ncbi:MAG: heavy metal translocating P-type ATPase [Pseudothermotoga sp.]
MKEFKKDFVVTGMTCVNCARTVEKSLKKIDGVRFAAVNLATSTGFIVAQREISFDEIKKAVQSVGYDVSLERSEDLEKKRYIQARNDLSVSLLISTPLMISMLYQMFKMHRAHSSLIEVLLAGVVVFYCGRKTIKGAVIALLHWHTNMDTLIFLGAFVSWLTGFLSLLNTTFMSFSTIGAMIITFHLTGRFIESHLRDRAAKEIKELLKIQAKEATVLTQDGEISMPIEAIKEDFTVLVRPSDRIPVDGIVLTGYSFVDESTITGEPTPVQKKEGDQVTSGSLNLTGLLKIKATGVGKDSFLSKMIELIKQAQGSKIPIQALADTITKWFVPAIFLLAFVSSAFWYLNYDKFTFIEKIPWTMGLNNLSFAIFVFVATIVIACPCALGLATPMALMKGTTLAAKKGLLIRNAEAIQTAKDVRVVLLDKTGTLTVGKPVVVKHNLDQQTLRVIAGIEKSSSHPLAKAISQLVDDPFSVEQIEEIAGSGVKAIYGGSEYFVGKPKNFTDYDDLLKDAKTVVEVRKDGDVVGFMVIEDLLREDSLQAIERLKKMRIETVIVTGDNEKTASAVAKAVGIEKIHSNVKPEEKLSIVRYYQSKGMKVAMVGDGINDAAALKGANVGIAIGSGTDLAIDSADIIISKGGVSKIVDVIEISKLTLRTIKQNLFWAFFYNVVAIPAAMIGLLHPLIAEVAMIVSSITVTVNSMRIKQKEEFS